LLAYAIRIIAQLRLELVRATFKTARISSGVRAIISVPSAAVTQAAFAVHPSAVPSSNRHGRVHVAHDPKLTCFALLPRLAAELARA